MQTFAGKITIRVLPKNGVIIHFVLLYLAITTSKYLNYKHDRETHDFYCVNILCQYCNIPYRLDKYGEGQNSVSQLVSTKSVDSGIKFYYSTKKYNQLYFDMFSDSIRDDDIIIRTLENQYLKKKDTAG
mgnify:CR=1 FL=1